MEITYANLHIYQYSLTIAASDHARLNILGVEEEEASRKAFLEYA